MSKIIKTKIKIDGMHCSSCALNIDFDLEDLEGVKKAHTSYARQELEVEYDAEKIKFGQVLEQIKKTGFTPTIV